MRASFVGSYQLLSLSLLFLFPFISTRQSEEPGNSSLYHVLMFACINELVFQKRVTFPPLKASTEAQ